MSTHRLTLAVFVCVLCTFAASTQNAPIVPDADHTLSLAGKVTDAQNGEAIPKFNVYFGHFGQNIQRNSMNKDRCYWEAKPNAGNNGTYKFTGSNAQASVFAVKITAEGYEPAVSRFLSPDEGNLTIDLALKKLPPEKSARIYGTVLLPDGKPAAKADVAMLTFYNNDDNKGLRIQNGRITKGEKPYILSTDNEGRFQFDYIDFEEEPHGHQSFSLLEGQQKDDFILYYLHDTGFAQLTQSDWEALDKNKTVKLIPWTRIEGTINVGTQPNKNQNVTCRLFINRSRAEITSDPFYSISVFKPDNVNPLSQERVNTDESGKFVFERVVPISRIEIGWRIESPEWEGYNYHITAWSDQDPSGTTTLTLGGVGRTVIGKLVPSEEFETPPDWKFAHIYCERILEKRDYSEVNEKLRELREEMIPRDILYDSPRTEKEVLLRKWGETEDGKKFKAAYDEIIKDVRAEVIRDEQKEDSRQAHQFPSDGTFRLYDMPEGHWHMQVMLYDGLWTKPGDRRPDRIGTLEYEFIVDAVPNGFVDKPLDLGTLQVAKYDPQRRTDEGRRPIIAVGETAPDFELVKIEPMTADGKYEDKRTKLRLSDYKGKYVLLDFWATWCGPCLAKVPELKTLHAKIKDDDRFVMIGISLDDDLSLAKISEIVAKHGMTWQNVWCGVGDWNSAVARNYKIRSIPALVLVGPDGKILLSDPILPELTKKIDDVRK